MTDEKYIYLEEQRNRKAEASGAKYRKNGIKSHTCNLPSDNYTPAELKNLNGEVSTIKLNKWYTWEEFKKISSDFQSAYLNYIIQRYNVGTDDIAKYVFEIKPDILDYLIETNALIVKKKKTMPMDESVKQFQAMVEKDKAEEQGKNKYNKSAMVDLDTIDNDLLCWYTWKEFKNLPIEKQQEYLANINHLYGVSLGTMAKILFHTTENNFRKYIKDRDIEFNAVCTVYGGKNAFAKDVMENNCIGTSAKNLLYDDILIDLFFNKKIKAREISEQYNIPTNIIYSRVDRLKRLKKKNNLDDNLDNKLDNKTEKTTKIEEIKPENDEENQECDETSEQDQNTGTTNKTYLDIYMYFVSDKNIKSIEFTMDTFDIDFINFLTQMMNDKKYEVSIQITKIDQSTTR